MKEVGQTNEPPAPASCRACCTRLTEFSVSVDNKLVLERLNLHMHCGELTVLIGPNGAGKSTLLRAMVGELPFSGTLEFFPSGKEGSRKPRVGYVPQRLDFDLSAPITVLDIFSAALSRRPLWMGYNRSVIRQAAASLRVVESESLLRCRAGALSGGELQLVLLALALTPLPEVLLLDEPVAAVDHAGTRLFYRMISELRQKYDLSVMLVSHDLSAAARDADRIVLLDKKIVCEGTPQDVMASAEVQQCFGLESWPAVEFEGRLPARHHTNFGSGGDR